MYLVHSGNLEFNKPLTREAIDAISKISYLDEAFTQAKVGDKQIEAEEQGRHFGENLNLVINALGPLGYTMNGVINYWGDYEGKIYVNDNSVDDIDISKTGLYEATDEELIKILRERGYKVLPKRVATNIIWDTDGEDVELPTEVLLPYDLDDELEADYLSDTYGFCVSSLSIEEVTI